MQATSLRQKTPKASIDRNTSHRWQNSSFSSIFQVIQSLKQRIPRFFSGYFCLKKHVFK
jgi:hypothetical protein